MSHPHDESKKEILLPRLRAGECVTDLSIETGISETTLYRWKRHAGRKPQASPSSPPSFSRVLAIPDMHHPFCSEDALPFLKAVKAKYQPTDYICLGDEVDFHALSRYPKDPDGFSAGHEHKAVIESLIPFYLEFPQTKVCVSNHTIRGHKLAFQSGLPNAFMNHISTILNAPDGWQWDDFWEIDNVRYFHGDLNKSGQYAHIHYLKSFKQSVVIGHIHAFGGVAYEGELFAVNSGCLIDAKKYAFAYAWKHATKPTLGCTMIFGGKYALFIPMLLDKNQRWTGQI